jgi:topoisomerase-4 subunit A
LSRFNFITNHKDSYLELISTDWRPQIEIIFVKEKGKDRNTKIINLEEFIAVKGEKALGNKLSSKKIKQINLIDSLPFNEEDENTIEMSEILTNNNNSNDDIKLDIKNDNNKGQITLEL